MTSYTPQRQALAEAYLGDTMLTKDLFASPETFDQRVLSLLQGLGQLDDVLLASAISGADVAAFLRAFDATSQGARLLEVARLRTQFVPSGVYKTFLAASGEASLSVAPGDLYASVISADLAMSIVSPVQAMISGKINFAAGLPPSISASHTYLYGLIEPPTEFNDIFDFIFDRETGKGDFTAGSFRCNLPIAASTAISCPVSCGVRLSKAGGNRIFFNSSLATKITVGSPAYEGQSSSFYFSATIPLVPTP